LENTGAKMISGHLHQVFSRKNYLCVGSVWSTSSLESNQIKALTHYDPVSQKISLHQTQINPYFLIEQKQETSDLFGEVRKDILDEATLHNHIIQITSESKKNFADNSVRDISFVPQQANLQDATVNLKVDDLDYDKIDEFVS
jgi:hypothetical protein